MTPGTADKRKTRRARAEFACMMRVLGEVEFEVPAVLLDFSGAGAALLSPEQVDPGTLVVIKHGDVSSLGEVRHCTRGPHGFRVGVEIER